jgi:WxL domain surface cell wall-binding
MRRAINRTVRFAGALVLLTAGIGVPVLLTAAPAQAVACGSAEAAGTTCMLTGTTTVTAGSLNLTSPGALSWSMTESGLDQQLVDSTVAHQSFTNDDATGSGAGWHITVSATQFTTGTYTLPNAGTFLLTGSTSSNSATTAPTAACSSGATCLAPTDSTTYPVAITTAASSPDSFTIYDTAANTGMGSMTIGVGADPVGWWVTVLAKQQAGTYTSTVTLEVISAP